MRYLKDIHYGVNGFYWALGSNLSTMIMYFGTQNLAKDHETKEVSADYDLLTIFYITIESITAFLALIWISKAFQLEKTAIIAPLAYLQLPIQFLYDIVFQKEEFRWN